ncbi:MAG: ribbon-helix-helix protein, CopG family [Caldilineaceae bacterium SB0661_bin_32]|uniref:Ribbon-helix-helix protein, CopG family n=1 Tax=Caldilineaceae bacterium SB0661_bin_32 TaxID=2605255 RepID=A0A6B1D3H4_9CHLR|nr:ribbon-helix-helix protein, CopG family [Caldilineaceae bacterium SB0661_bin_32]
MPRTTTTITFSLPREMADRVEEVVKQEGRSRSALLREALYRYLEENEWRKLLRYGEQRTRDLKITPEDVSCLVEEYRADTGSSRA